ncbi:hypothetical protein ACQJBY_005129 [Aegilops geniculata]
MPLKQPQEWASGGSMREKAFVMRVEEEDDTRDEDTRALVTTGAWFSCNDLESGGFEDSGDEIDCSSTPYHLMEKRSLEKSILLELELEHHLKIQEEVRSKLCSLEVCHRNEIQRTISAFARLQKYAESRKEIDRRLDVQFQRKIAEVLDKHLSTVQRDYEQKSQIVERRIRDESELPGIKVFADSIALEAESRRRALHDQVPSNIYLSKEYSQYGRQIGKSIGKLTPTTDSVKARASELIKALDGQDCPRPIACRLFADKMISIVKSRNTKDKTFGPLAFACGYVMLLVTNQVPDAMGYLLAEFHKVCMYTVPKHLHALNAQARKPDYYRLIGYQEEDEKPQSTESYLVNVVAYVKLYAAMIQTEIKGVRHPHGLAEGWKWLAMFLNTLPAITATAFALHAFLKMAGFALHKKYGSQFMKILDVISRRFIPALKEQGVKVQAEAVSNLQNYLNDKVYLEEPEGRYLAQHLLSKVFMCEDQHRMATGAPVSSRE